MSGLQAASTSIRTLLLVMNLFEQQFDDDVDLPHSLDLSKARCVQHQKPVNVDPPIWMIDSLDREANKCVTRHRLSKSDWQSDWRNLLYPDKLYESLVILIIN